MKSKGLTLTVVFEAESANYGESIGNVASLKKISRGKGEQYSYISRQALRYNLVNQMQVDHTRLSLDKSVIQFAPDAKIDEYPEIDLFGYMKTEKTTKTRAAVVRLSNAISLEPYRGDLDFLTNKGLFDRYLEQHKDGKGGGNIAQSEIHHSLYSYTLTIDLEKVGIDKNDEIEINNEEKCIRIKKLLNAVRYLYRDIRGRREDLKPLFVIGGVFDIKNPIYQGSIAVRKNRLDVKRVQDAMDRDIEQETLVGIVSGVFENESEIQQTLRSTNIREFFDKLQEKVENYYAGN